MNRSAEEYRIEKGVASRYGEATPFFFLLQRNFLKEHQHLKNLKNDADNFII